MKVRQAGRAAACSMRAYALALALSVCLGVVWAAPSRAAGRIFCVRDGGGSTSAPCTNTSAYTSIQAAVDAAADNDEIRIAASTYTGNTGGFVVGIATSLTLRGGYTTSWAEPDPAAATVIDGQNRVGGLQISEASVTLERLTITRGSNGGINANMNALQTLVLVDSIVANNRASSGGGMFSVGGKTELVRTTLINNMASEDGGGFYGADLSLIGSTIVNNVAARNAGGASAYQMFADRSLVQGNRAESGDGGGLHVYAGLTLRESQILSNSAGFNGGGVLAYIPRRVLVQSTVLGNNTAGNAVDGILIGDRSFERTDIQFVNSTVASQSRTAHQAILIQGAVESFEMVNTSVSNHAVGIQYPIAPLTGNYNAFFDNGTNLSVSGQDTPLPFATVVQEDPRFVGPAVNDFHLAADSPLIDAGDPGRSYSAQRDIDGQPLPVGAAADIGADEIFRITTRIYLPAVQR